MPIHDVAGIEDRELTTDAINQYLTYDKLTNAITGPEHITVVTFTSVRTVIINTTLVATSVIYCLTFIYV